MSLPPRLLLFGVTACLLAALPVLWPSPGQFLAAPADITRPGCGEARLSTPSRSRYLFRRPRSCNRVVLPSRDSEEEMRRHLVRVSLSPRPPASVAGGPRRARTGLSSPRPIPPRTPLYLVLRTLLV